MSGAPASRDALLRRQDPDQSVFVAASEYGFMGQKGADTETRKAAWAHKRAWAGVAVGILVATAVWILLPPASSGRVQKPHTLRALGYERSNPQRTRAGSWRGGDAPVAARKARKRVFAAIKRRDSSESLGRIAIPAINLNVPWRDGVYDANVELGPGHWPGTPLPGNTGNSVFAGHRTTYTHPFGDLDLVRHGDVIKTTLGEEQPVKYKVSRTSVITEAQYVHFVLRQPHKPGVRMITLFACTPKGYRTHRIVVQALAPRLEPQQRRQQFSILKGGPR